MYWSLLQFLAQNSKNPGHFLSDKSTRGISCCNTWSWTQSVCIPWNFWGDSSAFSSNEMALSGLPSQDCSLERPNRVRSLEFSALPALVQRKEKD